MCVNVFFYVGYVNKIIRWNLYHVKRMENTRFRNGWKFRYDTKHVRSQTYTKMNMFELRMNDYT